MADERPGGKALLIGGMVLLGLLFFYRNSGIGGQAPDFTLPETYGGDVSLASYRGHRVLLVFWTTSCGICRRELPILSNMAPELMKEGVSVVAIHLGQDDVRGYLRSNGVDLVSLVDADGTVGRAYHVSAVPRLVLVGEDGKVERSGTGMTDEGTLREWCGAGA
jgi:peroxiredoxin